MIVYDIILSKFFLFCRIFFKYNVHLFLTLWNTCYVKCMYYMFLNKEKVVLYSSIIVPCKFI